jgi:hypothetical protein
MSIIKQGNHFLFFFCYYFLGKAGLGGWLMPFPWVQFMTKQINKKNKETKQNKAGPISQLNKTQASPRIAARYMK